MSPYRVVISDDTAPIRLLLSMSLPAYGPFEVVAETSNGFEAVHAVRKFQPDLLLLDLSMPVMDGLSAAKEIRGFDCRVRIVVFTGFEAGSLAGRARALGVSAYVEKGIALNELADLLCAVMLDGAAARGFGPADDGTTAEDTG